VPPGDEEEDEEEKEERRRQEQASTGTDVGEAGAEEVGSGSCGSPSCDGPDCNGCDGPDCGCDLLLFVRLSTLLLIMATLLPAGGSGVVVRALIRGYQRRLSRYTPTCPSTPSCSAYALLAVEALGPRRGLAAAARRIDDCGG
jgi:membrane protein insertion efficiency factor YidD